MLYIVPTPIGNLKDITFRAIEVLNSVDMIACEDTRTSKALLNHYDIKNRLVSHHKFNEKASSKELVRLLKEGMDIALISDAGTPGISDPGECLKNLCIEEGIAYSVLPGANAIIPAYVMSCMKGGSFLYAGFVEREQKKKFFSKYIDIFCPIIFYESPNRLSDTLEIMFEVFGNRRVSVIREISKMHEEKYHANLEDAIVYFRENQPKGEIVLVLEGAKEEIEEMSLEDIFDIAIKRFQAGERAKDISKDLSKQYKIDRQIIYKKLSTL